MARRHIHGLLQKAKLDAEALHDHLQVSKDGGIWVRSNWTWIKIGVLARGIDREDFLLSKLSQETPWDTR